MDGRALAQQYFSTLAEIEESLGVPMLGRLDAEPRYYQLQEVLASLSPEPHFAERLYRLLEQHPSRIWVAGLGDAGEETPVAVGIAEQAAGKSGGSALLIRLQDAPADAAREGVLRPVISPAMAGPLEALFPRGCAAMPSGIQGVFRAFEASEAVGEPIAPESLIVSGGTEDEERWPPRQSIERVLLVVPFRDQTRERIVTQARAVAQAGYQVVGFVAFGPPGTAAGRWDGDVREGVQTGRSGSEREPEEPGLIGRAEDAAPDDETKPEGATQEEEDAAAKPPGRSDARIPVSKSWSDTYGPRRRGLFGVGGGRGGRGMRTLLPILAILALLVVLVVVGRQQGWDLPLIGGSSDRSGVQTQYGAAETGEARPPAEASGEGAAESRAATVGETGLAAA
ncbi:MAG: hypothetical protein GF330_00250, partial [Candidatus Eisenbacteria bacterium]|nr:hypothetical protein [Candidatus Eisenbacteria bacterium]